MLPLLAGVALIEIGCSTTPIYGLGVADLGAPEADAGAEDVGAEDASPEDAEPRDQGLFDSGAQPTCRFERLDPIETLVSARTSDGDFARVSDGFVAVATHRDDANRFQTYLYRIPDEGARPEPMLPSGDVPPSINTSGSVIATDGERVWVAFGVSRWLGGSSFRPEEPIAIFASIEDGSASRARSTSSARPSPSVATPHPTSAKV